MRATAGRRRGGSGERRCTACPRGRAVCIAGQSDEVQRIEKLVAPHEPPGGALTEPMGDAGTSAAIARLREAERRGAYAEAAADADRWPSALRSRPQVAVARARLRLRQGRVYAAAAALAEADTRGCTAMEQLTCALEQAWLRVYRDGAIRESVDCAQALLSAAATLALDDVDSAEAERIHARILLAAAAYREVDPAQVQTVVGRLPVVADRLEGAGKLDEAFAARLMHAERAERPADALATAREWAVERGLSGPAGEASLRRAERLVAEGAAREQVEGELRLAAQLFDQAGHVHGGTDVRCARARLDLLSGVLDERPLLSCLEAYGHVDWPLGAFHVLTALSQRAHERGDTRAAAEYRRRGLALADEMGLGLVRDGFDLAQMDLFMRAGAYGAAVELGQAALARAPVRAIAAALEHLVASAYAFVGDHAEAVEHGRRALALFEAMGAEESASAAAQKLALDLTRGLSRERADTSAWDAAADMLRTWVERDLRRGDHEAAATKHELLALVSISRVTLLRECEPVRLAEAQWHIEQAEALAQRLPARRAAARRGAAWQLRGQLAQANGDVAAAERAWLAAYDHYALADLQFEAANCQYIVGVLHLNRLDQDLLGQFREAESRLGAALAFYAEVGMRRQVADTCFMLATLYARAAPRLTPELTEPLLDAALARLAAAEDACDAMRRDYSVGSLLEAQVGKHALVQHSRRIYDLALVLLTTLRRDAGQAWEWAQRAKARALGDALGLGATPLTRILAELRRRPQALALVTEERDLVARLACVPTGERKGVRTALDELRERMGHDPHLGEYLDLRLGRPVDHADAAALLAHVSTAERACVAVDWFAVGDTLYLAVLRAEGSPILERIAPSRGFVRAFIGEHLNALSFRATLRDTPELLRQLDPLVAPLRTLTRQDELLVLLPTEPLHALPLHALEIDGEPLLARHPVVYAPSLGALRHCVARARPRAGKPQVALVGDPSGDRAEVAALIRELARRFGTEPLISAAVTCAALVARVAGCDLVHFQGHARHHTGDPLDSHLVLADGRLSAREVLDLRDLRAGLVTLAACESAASGIAPGDEPLGLIPAFLQAGAGAVLASLWRVEAAAARATMERFYGAFADDATCPDKAAALRAACLALRGTPGREAPYYWAPFVLYGDWQA